ncbi:MAG: hypothetical protein JRE45_18270 [Deltaproteobacteria bacterium]|nr:hypothetical protein [Deltaproteobacteria bacterium]MBW2687180.1 hypothetical protein [Deltaproteobacteria bacterium]
MRYLIGFMFVLAGLVALPACASAQAGEEGATSEPNLQEFAPSFEPAAEDLKEPMPSSEPAPEEPALQLQLDSAGVEVVPSPPRTADGYTLDEMELRVRRAKIGLAVSAIPFIAGIGLSLAAGFSSMVTTSLCFEESCPNEPWVTPVGVTGAVLTASGLAGTIATGILLRRRKRDWDSLREAHYGGPRRVRWDLARSRLVF